MHHITFDTLEMVRRLEAKGFKREQAEEVISVVKDVQQELATKADIEALKKDVKVEIHDLRKDMEALRKDVKADIDALRQEMKNLELRITIKLSTIIFTLLLAFKVLDKFI